MNRVALLLLVVLLGSASLPGFAGGAPPPSGPRLASVALTETPGSEREEDPDPPLLSLQTFGPTGGARQLVLQGELEAKAQVVPMPFWGPAWSGDGNLLAFTGATKKGRQIFVSLPDGTAPRPVPGTMNGANPVVSPDGGTIAFQRSRSRRGGFFSTATWMVSLSEGKPRRLTPWRDDLVNEPSGFSPDGTTLALTRRDNRHDGPSVVLMRLDGSGASEFVRLGEEATFSPDGSRLAFVGYMAHDLVEAEEDRDYMAAELYAIGADGSGLRRLTHSRGVVESAPSWDPSGQRIAYVRARASTSFVPGLDMLFPVGNAIAQVNADGTCDQKVLSLRRVAFYGVAWQPGAGREAGRLSC